MSDFSARVAALCGVAPERIERLAGGDLSQVLLVPRADGGTMVAKGGSAIGTEAAMLRAIAAAGIPAPSVEAELDGVLLLEHVANDRVFSSAAWADIGARARSLHDRTGEGYGWPVDYALASVALDNRDAASWPEFWGQRRLVATSTVLDRPWRVRIEALVHRIDDLLPTMPIPSLLHGDLWSGNILVADGSLAALIDPACYYGHAEVDLAMLTLFDSPPQSFWSAYGPLEPGWEQRRPIYQLFPIIVHLRLFGASYAASADRLLTSLGC